MPVYRTPTDRNQRTAALTDRLAEVLANPSSPGQPLVIENPIGLTGKFHIAVLWDDWQGLSHAQRSRVILDAYEKRQPDMAEKITIAIGAIGDEAIRMGYLPYVITSGSRSRDFKSFIATDELMGQFCPFETQSGPQLRFYSEECASIALAELRRESPEPQWRLDKEDRTASE